MAHGSRLSAEDVWRSVCKCVGVGKEEAAAQTSNILMLLLVCGEMRSSTKPSVNHTGNRRQ